MIDGLTELETKRPKPKKRKVYTINDITTKIRKEYSVIRRDGSDENFDKLILDLLNHMSSSWWTPFQYMFYIPSLARLDMFQLLPIGTQDADDVKKQYMFISNMNNLYKTLRPSYYGSQQDNFDAYVDFHEMSTNLVNKNKMVLKSDTILFDIAYVLKERLKGINNQETIDAIKKDITEGLDDYGYKINLE